MTSVVSISLHLRFISESDSTRTKKSGAEPTHLFLSVCLNLEMDLYGKVRRIHMKLLFFLSKQRGGSFLGKGINTVI